MVLPLTPGGKTLVHVGFIKITEYGLSTAVYMAIRLIYLIMGSSLMTLTTTPNSLTDGLEKLLHPLNKLHVPVHEISMMMSIALRFIPILLEETDKIMKAQIARGADMESGNLIQKAKAMIPILVPLFVSAFRRANDLAMAMEARCYRGGNGRTKMKPTVIRSRMIIGFSPLTMNLNGTFASLMHPNRNTVASTYPKILLNVKREIRYSSVHTIFTRGSSLWIWLSAG